MQTPLWYFEDTVPTCMYVYRLRRRHQTMMLYKTSLKYNTPSELGDPA